MDNKNIINITLHVLDNGCNQIQSISEKEFISGETAEITTIEQSESLSTKLNLLAEINDQIKEAQEIIQQCRTLSKILNGITGI